MTEQSEATRGVEGHGTQTYYTDDGPREMVLIGVPLEQVGNTSTYPPQNPSENGVSTAMRRTYFIHSEDCLVQFPRRADDYPVAQEKYDLADICWELGAVHAYYPLSSEEALRVTWKYTRDEWNVGRVRFDNYADQIEDKHTATIWKNRRSL